MNQSDYSTFEQIVNADNERRGKPKFSGFVLEQLFEDLEDITIDQFLYAAKCHRRSAEGMFALSAANIRKQLGLSNVQDLDWRDVLVMAKGLISKNPDTIKTPLMVVVGRYIKSGDISNNSDIENKGLADNFLADLSGILFRLENGEFTEHEITLCGKYGVNPNGFIHTGHNVLPDAGVLTAKIAQVKRSPMWLGMLEDRRLLKADTEQLAINAEGQKRVVAELSKISSSVKFEEKRNYTAAEAEQILKDDLK